MKAEVEEAVEEAKEVVEETTEEATAEEIETVEMKIEALTTAVADISTQILEIKALADAVTKVYSQVGEVSKAVATLGSELNSLKANDQEFGKRVDAVEKDTAFRKSADFGEVMQVQPEMAEKSLWAVDVSSRSPTYSKLQENITEVKRIMSDEKKTEETANC